MPSAQKTTNYNLNQWNGNEYPKRQDFVDDNAAIDAALTPTADPTKVPAGLVGKLSDWVSWFTNRIKTITGKTNWYDTPDVSLATANTHINAAAPHTGHVSHSLATAANDFLVASGAGAFVKKTLAEVKSILGLGTAAYTASSAYATSAQGTKADNAMPASGGVFTGAVSMGRQNLNQPRLKDYSEAVVTNNNAAGTVSINLSNGNVFNLTLTGNVTLTFDNPAPSGQASSFVLAINQGVTAYTVTWPSSLKWDWDSVPDISGVGKTYLLVFTTFSGGTRWYGRLAMGGMTT